VYLVQLNLGPLGLGPLQGRRSRFTSRYLCEFLVADCNNAHKVLTVAPGSGFI